MFVLDTCFISEFTNKSPNSGVVSWMRQQAEAELFLTTMTLGEIVKGIKRLPMGPKRSRLERWHAVELRSRFRGRILSLDEAASYQWGCLCAHLELAGKRMPAVDSQIAAICLLHDAVLVTRNEADFTGSGVRLLNPWT